MAITKNYVNEVIRAVLVLSALLSTASAVDCNGKSFRCVNSTHFMICVDLGGGVSQAIDNFYIACPPPTACQGTNHFECEFPAPTTPSSTLSNVISETTVPWEEVVTASSLGNATKEFSENYMNTERIITTAEYSITTDATLDLNASPATGFDDNNELNIPGDLTTPALEIATVAVERTSIVNENLNKTEAIDNTTAVIEAVTQITGVSKSLTEPEMDVETVTKNIIITDTIAAETEYFASSATDQIPVQIEDENMTEIGSKGIAKDITQNTVASGILTNTKHAVIDETTTTTMETTTSQVPVQSIDKNITDNISKGVAKDITTTVIEDVIQNTAVSGILTSSNPSVIDETTTTTMETTTDNIIITHTLGTDLGYIKPTLTEQVTESSNDNLLELQTVQSNTEPHLVNVLRQNEGETNNTLLKEHKTDLEHLTVKKKSSSTVNSITATNIDKVIISNTTNAAEVDSIVQNSLPVQTPNIMETIVDTTTDGNEYFTTTSVDRITDDFIIVTPSLNTNLNKSESAYVSETSKPSTSTTTPRIKGSVVPSHDATIKNSTDNVATTKNKRIDEYSVSSTTSLYSEISLDVTVTTDGPAEYFQDAKENILTTNNNITIYNNNTTADKSLHENNYTLVAYSSTDPTLLITPNTLDSVHATVSDGKWAETAGNDATTEQQIIINKESITTDTTPNIVTGIDQISIQAVNLQNITTDTEPTTDSITQPMPPVIADTTEVVDVSTKISNVQQLPPAFKDNKNTKVLLDKNAPATDNIISTVYNYVNTNNLVTAQGLDLDLTTTDTMNTYTTVSNGDASTSQDNIKTEAPLITTVNFVSSTNDQAGTEAPLYTTVNIVSSTNDKTGTEPPLYTTVNIVPAKNDKAGTEDPLFTTVNIVSSTNDKAGTEPPLLTTVNIVSSITDGADINGLLTTQPVQVDKTEPTNYSTAISNAVPIAPTFIDTTAIDVPPATENIVSSVNNGPNINGLIISPPVNEEVMITETIYIPTTITAFEENMATNVPFFPTENIISSSNIGASAKDSIATQEVTENITNTDLKGINNSISSIGTTMIPSFANKVTTDVPLLAEENIASIVNNGATTNGLNLEEPVYVGIINTEATYIHTINNNDPAMASNSDDNRISETATSAIHDNSDSINVLATPVDLEQRTQNAGIKFTEQVTKVTHSDPSASINQISLSNEKPMDTSHGDIPTTENGKSVKGIEENSNTAIQKTQKILNGSANPATESDVTVKYEENKATTISTNYIIETDDISTLNLPDFQLSSNNTSTSTAVLIGIENTNNAFLPDAQYNQNEAGSIINTAAVNGKVTMEKINETIPEHNITITRTELEQNTTSSATAGYPIYTNINEREQNIDSITNIDSIGVTSPKDILETKQYSENIDKINSEPGTGYKPNSQSKFAVTVDASNLKTDKLASVGIEVSSATTSMPFDVQTPVVDTSILDTIQIHKSIDNSFSPPSASPVVKSDIIIEKAGITTEVQTDILDNINAQSYQENSILSISTSDSIPEVVHNNQFELPTSAHDSTNVGTRTKGNQVNEENDTLSNPVVLNVSPLPINDIKYSYPSTNTPVLKNLSSTSKTGNTVTTTDVPESEMLKPIFTETRIPDSENVGYVTTASSTGDHVWNFDVNISDGNGYTTSKDFIQLPNSQNSAFTPTMASNGESLSQPSQHVEKIPDKKASGVKNGHVIPNTNDSGSGSENIISPNSSTNANNRLTTPKYATESRYEQVKSDKLLPQASVSSKLYTYQKNNFTSDTQPIQSTGSKTLLNPPQNNSTNITLSPQTENLSTSTAQTPSRIGTLNPISHVYNNLNKQLSPNTTQTFSCINGIRGRYSDKDDCRKFYVCFGHTEPIVGHCPENSVFSDHKKLCTKNMSHCIRENQFKCPSAGRFSDYIKDNIYYICVKHRSKLYKFTFQCQKGYIFDKTTVKCIETKEIESNESVSISSDNTSQSSSSISSSTSNKSVSASSTSNGSSRTDDSSSKNEDRPKSKKNNKAEISEKSEGNDDEDDDDEDVFKCKKEGKFPIRNECRRYYLCKKNKESEYRRKVKKCDSGKVFHKDKKKCVDDDSYEC